MDKVYYHYTIYYTEYSVIDDNQKMDNFRWKNKLKQNKIFYLFN